jgi:hypothetical protein
MSLPTLAEYCRQAHRSRLKEAGRFSGSRLQIKDRGSLRLFNASLAGRRLGEGGTTSTTDEIFRSFTYPPFAFPDPINCLAWSDSRACAGADGAVERAPGNIR